MPDADAGPVYLEYAPPPPRAAPLRRDEALAPLRAHAPELERRSGVRLVALFGSVARDEARPDSDVDLLVEYTRPPGLHEYMGAIEYLDDAIAYADPALALVHGLERRAVFDDVRTRFAVLHALEVIGEAVKHLPAQARDLAPAIPWRLIAGFRDRLAQHYRAVEGDVVWDVLARDLPALRDAALAIRAASDPTS